MDEHEDQNEDYGNQAKHKAMDRQEVSKVVHDRQRHDGDGRGVRGPEADPAAEESQGAGTGLTEVDILAAVFREGRGQLGIAEVGGDLEQTANDESQEQEQGASGRIGDLGQGREDAGADGRAYTEGNDRAQT